MNQIDPAGDDAGRLPGDEVRGHPLQRADDNASSPDAAPDIELVMDARNGRVAEYSDQPVRRRLNRFSGYTMRAD